LYLGREGIEPLGGSIEERAIRLLSQGSARGRRMQFRAAIYMAVEGSIHVQRVLHLVHIVTLALAWEASHIRRKSPVMPVEKMNAPALECKRTQQKEKATCKIT